MNRRREKRDRICKTAPHEKLCWERERRNGIVAGGACSGGRMGLTFDRKRDTSSTVKGRKDKVSVDAYRIMRLKVGK